MHWDIVLDCVGNPKKWELIPLPHNKDLSTGTGFERALHDAGNELSKLAKTEGEVTFWIRGDVMLVTENGGLKLLPQGNHPAVELKVRMEGVLEKCFRAVETTGESESFRLHRGYTNLSAGSAIARQRALKCGRAIYQLAASSVVA